MSEQEKRTIETADLELRSERRDGDKRLAGHVGA
jgi:hypothetical protein